MVSRNGHRKSSWLVDHEGDGWVNQFRRDRRAWRYGDWWVRVWIVAGWLFVAAFFIAVVVYAFVR